MLKDGRALKDAGIDVAIGLVETYGRADTEAQLAGLAVIPRRRLSHKNVEIEEITHVIFGQSSRTRVEIVMKGSTLNRFLEEVKGAAVQVVPL